MFSCPTFSSALECRYSNNYWMEKIGNINDLSCFDVSPQLGLVVLEYNDVVVALPSVPFNQVLLESLTQ